jgi:hypothetical protein
MTGIFSESLLCLKIRPNLAGLHKAQDTVQLAYAVQYAKTYSRVFICRRTSQTRAAASWVNIVAASQSQSR